MKVFVSWSGELSCQIAEVLKKWIPCIIQSVDVFFSPEDIEKGDNWDKTISSELSECKYGIICLTSDNTSAPWINFEAGAIAKSLDSKVTALMVNIKPSDIKGPLSRYQATRFEKADFFQLIESINTVLDTPLDSKVLENTFNAMWDSLEAEAIDLINKFSQKGDSQNKKGNITESEGNNPLEEILQLLRKQSAILSNPQQLLPPDYMEHIQMSMYSRNREMYTENQMIFEELINVLEKTLIRLQSFPNHPMLNQFIEIFNYEDVRRQLENYYSFTTRGMCEVITKAYDRWGDGCFDRFEGYFSIVIYNRWSEEILLSRDRFCFFFFFFVFFFVN